MKTPSVSEIRAVAEAAINARHAANAAKTAHEAATDDASLKTAYESAEKAAVAAEAAANALSQGTSKTPEQIAKMKRKVGYLTQELRDAGALEDDDTGIDDDDDMDDPNRVVTVGDLKRMKAQEATQTAVQMAESIEDVVAREAVKAALRRVVASGDPQKDFTDAVAIANREKNSKVLEEIARRPIAPAHRSGAGAPPNKPEGAFEPTASEAAYMRPPFNLTKEDILKSRPQNQ